MGKSTHFIGQPMYNQALKLLDKSKILRISREKGGERYTKRFNGWGSVNRTVSSYFLPYSPQQETMHGFLLSFFLLAKLHDFISITKFDGQLL